MILTLIVLSLVEELNYQLLRRYPSRFLGLQCRHDLLICNQKYSSIVQTIQLDVASCWPRFRFWTKLRRYPEFEGINTVAFPSFAMRASKKAREGRSYLLQCNGQKLVYERIRNVSPGHLAFQCSSRRALKDSFCFRVTFGCVLKSSVVFNAAD
ncbi:uncharacterized protein LY79DRAFT_51907 [Colletotrichum navitas]|uniref:Uncharacterized protein n=1 Tax=Colletotrichum navitas TaxID=681940 RepID=A0AAD8Q6K0_9PEZI|nr:uncharacterized protein LY79DRAFT_51907 [Colletotrichum navitas]KAK1596722.1 hypothetical protein LY79DRAFT_51907 [Colletotrichum navitas]